MRDAESWWMPSWDPHGYMIGRQMTPQQPVAGQLGGYMGEEAASNVLLGFVVGFSYVCLFVFFSLGLHQRHREVPRLGVQLEPQPSAYVTATAMLGLSCICDYTTAHGKAGSLTH